VSGLYVLRTLRRTSQSSPIYLRHESPGLRQHDRAPKQSDSAIADRIRQRHAQLTALFPGRRLFRNGYWLRNDSPGRPGPMRIPPVGTAERTLFGTRKVVRNHNDEVTE